MPEDLDCGLEVRCGRRRGLILPTWSAGVPHAAGSGRIKVRAGREPWPLTSRKPRQHEPTGLQRGGARGERVELRAFGAHLVMVQLARPTHHSSGDRIQLPNCGRTASSTGTPCQRCATSSDGILAISPTVEEHAQSTDSSSKPEKPQSRKLSGPAALGTTGRTAHGPCQRTDRGRTWWSSGGMCRTLGLQ